MPQHRVIKMATHTYIQFKIFIVVLRFYGQYQSHSLQYGVQTEQIIYFKIFNHIMCFYSIRLASIRIT